MGFNRVNNIEGEVLGGVTSGLYRKAPWHGQGEVKDSQGRLLGVKRELHDDVRHRDTIKVLAGLDWEPREVMLQDLAPGLVSSRKMLVRDGFPTADQSYDLGVHSGKYGVISNDEGLSFAEEIMRVRSDAKLQSCTTLYGGSIVFAVLEFHDGVQVTRSNGDVKDMHTPYMGVYWSHDGSHPLGVKFMRHEWVCENTFTPWNAETGLVIRHTVNASERASHALRAVERMMTAQDEFDVEIQRLLATPLLAQPGDFVRNLIGERPKAKVTLTQDGVGQNDRKGINWDKQFDEITSELRDFTDGATAFDFVMAVQGYEQHRQKVRGGGRDVKTITRLIRDDFPMTKKAASLFAVDA